MKTKSVIVASIFGLAFAASSWGQEPAATSDGDVAASSVSPEQKLESPDQQLMEVEIKNVSMRCFVTDSGHRVKITASNTENRNRSCRSTCYYRTSQGYNGTLSASGTVPARANNVTFGSHYNSSITFTVTNPGSFSCQ